MFINILMLLLAVLGMFAEQVSQKQYNIKMEGVKNSNYVYNFYTALTSFVIAAVVAIFSFQFSATTLLYGVAFSVFSSGTLLFMFLAIKEGSFALSSLIISFSLIIPTLYGIAFLGETLSVIAIIGLICLAFSIVLVNKYKKGEKVSVKWFIFIVLAFLCNGIALSIQKVYSNTENANMFTYLFFGMLSMSVITGILLLVNKPKDIKGITKKGGLFGVIMGASYTAVNVSMLFLGGRMPASIMFPVISGGGIVLTFIAALTIYKERLSRIQFIGYFLGIASIILLNI